jgi:hypothetical protein
MILRRCNSYVITSPTIRKCSHGIYIASGDDQAIYCHLCTPGGIYPRPTNQQIAKWEQILQKSGLGEMVGTDHVYESEFIFANKGEEFSGGGFIDGVRHRKLNWTAEGYPVFSTLHDSRGHGTPPRFGSLEVPRLMARLTPNRRAVVELRVLEELDFDQIAKRLGLSRTVCEHAFADAMDLMRKETAREFKATGNCAQCGKEFQTNTKGRPQKFCSNTCKSREFYYRKPREKAALVQLYPPISATLHPVQLYPHYAAL